MTGEERHELWREGECSKNPEGTADSFFSKSWFFGNTIYYQPILPLLPTPQLLEESLSRLLLKWK